MKFIIPDDVVLEPAVAAQQLDGVVELEVGLHIVEARLRLVVVELAEPAVEVYYSTPMNLDPFLMSLR